MRKEILPLLISLCLLAYAAGHTRKKQSRPEIKEIDTLYEIEEDDFYLYFHDPTCAYCQNTDALIDIYLSNDPDIPLYAVSAGSDLWEDTEFIPTLIYYENKDQEERLEGYSAIREFLYTTHDLPE